MIRYLKTTTIYTKQRILRINERNNCSLSVFYIAAISLSLGIVCKGQSTQNTVTSESIIELQKGTEIIFAGVEEAQKRLTTKDGFINALSSFDRSARLKTDRTVSEKEFLEHLANQVKPWTDDEKNKIRAVIESISDPLKPFGLKFPQKILLIKTTGKEEGGATYCRPNAIVMPQNILKN